MLFKAPIPSFDADLNPNSIRVSYEVDSGEAFAVYGADAQVQATEKLRVGGVYVRDEDPGKSFGMRAVTGEYKFGERTRCPPSWPAPATATAACWTVS